MTAENEIHRRIKKSGVITFAEFMDLALYWPGGGYYARGDDPIGTYGDFYTSPLSHPAFGSLISLQLFQMWRLMGRPVPFTVVELGAGNGLLCRDLAKYSKNLPDNFPDTLRYICLDVDSHPGFEKELTASGEFTAISRLAADAYGWGRSNPQAGLPLAKFQGCVLSNELLDALPVHQAVLQGGRLLESYVTWDHGELVIIHDEPSTPRLQQRLDELDLKLSEGQTVEICLGLTDWAKTVSESLEAGFVLTVDYGRKAKELYSNRDRDRGTLTTFHQHTQTDAPFRRIGAQDITTQVDFTSVINEGWKYELAPIGYSTQFEFLINLGIRRWQRDLTSLKISQAEANVNRAGMANLVRHGGLGDFKVLAQSKGLEDLPLWGFQTNAQPPELELLLESLPLPLMGPDHLKISQGWNHVEEFQMDQLWPLPTALNRDQDETL